jgi:tetratricopeptide (TPR) repeat protein
VQGSTAAAASLPFRRELLGWILRSRGQVEQSIASFQIAIEMGGPDARLRSALASAYAAAGQRAEAVAILRDLERLRKTEFVPTEAFVAIHAALDNRDDAFTWLERSADDRSISYFLFDLRYEDLYRPLREDPRLARLFQAMGLELNGPP